MKSSNRGFTLIELIIVIVILGILAVTASPRFLDLTGDARASTVQGMEAAVKGAVGIVNAKALVQGHTGSDAQTTNPAVDVKFGYPDATVAAMQAILDIQSDSAKTIANQLATTEWEIAVDTNTTPDSVKIYPVGDFDGLETGVNEKNCFVRYTEADSSNEATVTSVITGC